MRQIIVLFIVCFGVGATSALAKSVKSTAPAPAATPVTQVRLHFKIYMGGAKIAQMTVEMSLGDKEYWVKGSGRTLGLLDKVARTRFSASSHGFVTKGQVRPQMHTSALRQKKKNQRVEIIYDEDGAPEIKSDPAFKKSSNRSALLARTLLHTIDPASLFVSPVIAGKSVLSPNQCKRRARVLDGQRRVDVVYKHKASYGAYRMRKPDYLGPALLCTARFALVGGIKPNGALAKLARKKAVEILLVPVGASKYLVPLRIVTDSPLGKIVLRARGFSAKSATRKISLRGQ
ncbi:MAG: DUF3108 domain-containing protein [Alphaproteobacteria bacterium]